MPHRTTRNVAIAFASCVCLGSLAPPASGAQTNGTLSTAAPVLARIVQKKVAEAKVGTGPVQWAYVSGKGVVYLVPVNLLEVRSTSGADSARLSPQDADWENARRELKKQAPLSIDNRQRTEAAIGAAAHAIERFGDRLPLGPGEAVKVVLWNPHFSSRKHALPINVGGVVKGPYRPWIPGGGRKSSATAGSPTIQTLDATNRLLAHMALAHGRSKRDISFAYVVVDETGEVSRATGDLDEDTKVLAHILDKRLRETFPKEFWGIDTFGYPGVTPFIIDGWGPVIAVNLTFPIDRNAEAKAGAGDLWERTAAELRGRDVSASGGLGAAGLVDPVKRVLVDFGSRLRGMNENQLLTVVIYGARGAVKPSQPYVVDLPASHRVEGALEHFRLALDLRTRSGAPRAPHFTLQVAASDLAAHRDKEIDSRELRERIRASTATASSPERERSRQQPNQE